MAAAGPSRGRGRGQTRSSNGVNEIVMPYEDDSRWASITSAMENIRSGEVTDVAGLGKEMRTYNSDFVPGSLSTLVSAFGDSIDSDTDKDEFWKGKLKSMAYFVLEAPKTFGTTPIPVLKSGDSGSVQFTARQCVTIVCIGFFCAWPYRTHLGRYTGLAPMNFTALLGPPNDSSKTGSQIAKLRCFVNYVSKRLDPYQNVYQNSSWYDEEWPEITVTRRFISSELDDIVRLRGHVAVNDDDVTFRPSGNMHADDAGTVEVDFANAYLGGGVLGKRGAVQEEIRVAQCPDLLCMRLVCPRLGPDDAVNVIGFDVTNDTKGYASSFEYVSTRSHGPPESFVRRKLIAIDATDYSSARSTQYNEALIRREIKKAYVGFEREEGVARNQAIPSIVTGNWGAGAFGGDPLLKVAIQVVAATLTGRKLVYYTNETSGSNSFGLKDAAKALLRQYDGVPAAEVLRQILENPPQFSKSTSFGASTGNPYESIADLLEK